MNVVSKRRAARHEIRDEQGFKAYVLGTDKVEMAVVPELGAKIISIKDLRSGRDWMWHPRAGLKLFRNRPGDDFSKGPLVGVDECFPTIAPCTWKGRSLPDHGEVWTSLWSVNDRDWEKGLLRTTTRLSLSPFQFERAIEVWENEVRLNYRLRNEGGMEESFLWAIHPLLNLCPGDGLELPASTRALLNGDKWVDALHSGCPRELRIKACCRAFPERRFRRD